jgi:putative tryptophan/tyrosine transport system substrate-binding protein
MVTPLIRLIDQVSRRELVAVLAALAAVRLPTISAQQPARSVVGPLTIVEASGAGLAAWRSALCEAGFVKGRNLAVEFRWAEGASRLPAGAAQPDGVLGSAQAKPAAPDAATAR